MKLFIAAFLALLLCSTPSARSETTHTLPNDISVEIASLSRVEAKARNAAVRVRTSEGYGSGTYAIVAGKHVVITAAHVIMNEGAVTSSIVIQGRMGESSQGTAIYVDPDNDFAIVICAPLATRTALKIKKSSKTKDDLIGEKITYTGFPNNHDLMTIKGSIAGHEHGFLLLQSYTWMGASGSGVFDSSGNFVGVLTAVDIGRAYFPQIVESVVWVVPLSNIEMSSVESIVQKASL